MPEYATVVILRYSEGSSRGGKAFPFAAGSVGVLQDDKRRDQSRFGSNDEHSHSDPPKSPALVRVHSEIALVDTAPIGMTFLQ